MCLIIIVLIIMLLSENQICGIGGIACICEWCGMIRMFLPCGVIICVFMQSLEIPLYPVFYWLISTLKKVFTCM